MKILAFSDSHGKDLRQLICEAEKNSVEAVFACGDWSMLDNVPKYFASQFSGKKLFVLPGNHESFATFYSLLEQYNLENLHGNGVMLGDIGFFGAGCSTKIGPNSRISEHEMWGLLEKAHEKIRRARKKIMVVHEHPDGSVLGLGRFPGSASVRKAIETFRPDLVICGHIHETAGVEDKIEGIPVVNVAKEGKILDI